MICDDQHGEEEKKKKIENEDAEVTVGGNNPFFGIFSSAIGSGVLFVRVYTCACVLHVCRGSGGGSVLIILCINIYARVMLGGRRKREC